MYLSVSIGPIADTDDDIDEVVDKEEEKEEVWGGGREIEEEEIEEEDRGMDGAQDASNRSLYFLPNSMIIINCLISKHTLNIQRLFIEIYNLSLSLFLSLPPPFFFFFPVSFQLNFYLPPTS